MAGFGGYFKGEKKKKKKEIVKNTSSGSGFSSIGTPTFTLPKLISKKPKEY